MSSLVVQSRLSHAVTITIVLLVVAACYHSTLSFSPIWDDIYADIAGYYLRDDAWHIAFSESYISPNYYRPLPVLTRAYESFHAGIKGVGYSGHFINLAVHLCSTLLVMLLVSRMYSSYKTKNYWIVAPLAGLFFGLHPAALPIPAWISARFDLMLVLFILLALSADVFLQNIRWRCAGISAAFLGAALCKETAIVFPFLLPLWHWLLIQTNGRNDNWHVWRNNSYIYIYASVFTAGLIYLLMRYLGLGYLVLSESIQEGQLASKSVLQHAWLILETLGLYFRLLLFPFGAIRPSFVQGPEFSVLNTHAMLGITVLITTISTLLLQKTRTIGIVLALLIISILPILNFIPTPIKDSFADLRFSYIMIALCSITLIPQLLQKVLICKSVKRIAVIALLLGWLCLAYWNIQRTLPAWKDDVHFWTWYIETHPGTLLGLENLVTAYNTAGQFTKAMPIADEYMRISPPSSKAHVLRGYTLLKLRQFSAAEAEFLEAIPMIKETGEWSKALAYIAEAQLNQSKMDDVPALIEQILHLEPGNGNANMIKLKYGLLKRDARMVHEAYTQLQFNYALRPMLLHDVLLNEKISSSDIAPYLPPGSPN